MEQDNQILAAYYPTLIGYVGHLDHDYVFTVGIQVQGWDLLHIAVEGAKFTALIVGAPLRIGRNFWKKQTHRNLTSERTGI